MINNNYREKSAIVEFFCWVKLLFFALLVLSTNLKSEVIMYQQVFNALNITTILLPLSALVHGNVTILVAAGIESLYVIINTIYLALVVVDHFAYYNVVKEPIILYTNFIFILIIIFLQIITSVLLYLLKDTAFINRFSDNKKNL
jgi:hypothetical protein